VIITRTPLRISLGGGGTDLPAYYTQGDGGFLVAAAINRHVYIAVNRNFNGDLLLKYSETERADKPEDVVHPLLREALLVAGVSEGVEVSAMADVPAGTGLGSSGAFTVGLLRALLTLRRQTLDARDLAELACDIEMNRLGAPVGKQDPYIASIGGVTAFAFSPDGQVAVRPVPMADDVRDQLEDNLVLFYTGVRRSAAEELAPQFGDDSGNGVPRENLDAVRALGGESCRCLEEGDLDAFAGLLTEQWRRKYERSPSALHDQVDAWIRAGLAAGATGGKLVGAGGGGFLLFYAEDKAGLRRAMADAGLQEVRFGFDYAGSTTIVT
jgi:D-glycero-alpha-D-manno-heptose-7-phosphate kinase